MDHRRIYLNESDDRVYIDTSVVDYELKRDAMLVIPGGGYAGVCADREGEPIALEFVSRGYNAFVLNYRVGPNDHFPKQLLDAGAAMIYIRDHAEELKVNPGRVFAVGFSAGGHLAGCLATMYAYPEVKEAYGEDYKKVRPTGAILSYPVVTLLANTHQATFKNLLGRPNGEFTEEECKRYSIDCIVDENTSPMFVWHTVEDQIVPVAGSIRLAAALTEHKVPMRMSIFPYGPHGVALANQNTYRWSDAYVQPMAQVWPAQADEWMKTLKDY